MSFTLFGALPAEIRDAIWEQAAIQCSWIPESPRASVVGIETWFRPLGGFGNSVPGLDGGSEDSSGEDTEDHLALCYDLVRRPNPTRFGRADEKLDEPDLTEHPKTFTPPCRSPRIALHLVCHESRAAVRRYERKRFRRPPSRRLEAKHLALYTDDDLFILEPTWGQQFLNQPQGRIRRVRIGTESTCLPTTPRIAVPWISLFPHMLGKPEMPRDLPLIQQHGVRMLEFLIRQVARNVTAIFIVIDEWPDNAWEEDNNGLQARFQAVGREYFEVDPTKDGLEHIRQFILQASHLWQNEAKWFSYDHSRPRTQMRVMSWKEIKQT